jgi:hypothetical protein
MPQVTVKVGNKALTASEDIRLCVYLRSRLWARPWLLGDYFERTLLVEPDTAMALVRM